MRLNRPLSTAAVLLLIAGCSSSGPAGRPPDTFGSGGSLGTGGEGSGSGGTLGTAGTLLGSAGSAGTLTTSDPTKVDGGKGDCDTTLAVTYRDFTVGPDFERAFAGDVVRRGLVQSTLGPDQKPVFLDSAGKAWKPGTPLDTDVWSGQPVITSAETFKQWYNTTDKVNIEIKKTIEITETPPGSGNYLYQASPFFPLSNDEGFGITPPGSGHNFLFTTEIHVKFGYVAHQVFSFSGDDDLWIFINGKLALDLGSTHSPADGTIDFDAQAASLGIAVGQTYPMDIFHAERHTSGSNFKVTTNISCFSPTAVVQ